MVALVVTFGVALVAVGILLAGLLAMLEGEDRRALVTLLRHPVRTVFGADGDAGDDR